MKFNLDAGGRFCLIAREGGWDMVVDEKRVFYCLTPVDAVMHMSEVLREEDTADGVKDVVDALSRIEIAAMKAVDIIITNDIAAVVADVYSKIKRTDTRSKTIEVASLSLAKCSRAELSVRHDRHDIVTKAKAILEPWFMEAT